MSRTILAEHAAELHEIDEPGTTAGPWTHVGRQHVRTSRWHEYYYLVVRDETGGHWGVLFGEGLTESQEHNLPWEDDESAELPLTRLYPHEVIRVEYRTKPTGGGSDA